MSDNGADIKKADEKAETKAADSQPAQPVFGSSFGGQGGFAGFTGVTPPSKAAAPAEGEGEDAANGEEEEECKAEFTPLVHLDEVPVNTGEEDEECLKELKCKLYRYDADAKEWKERGIGQAKFLRNKESQKTRLLMRQDKTLKIRANHIVMPGTNIRSHGGSDKAWVWSAVDFADEAQALEMFAIRFGSPEKANEFKEQYEASMAANAPLLATAEPADLPEDPKKEEKAEKDTQIGKDADELASKVEATKVA